MLPPYRLISRLFPFFALLLSEWETNFTNFIIAHIFLRSDIHKSISCINFILILNLVILLHIFSIDFHWCIFFRIPLLFIFFLVMLQMIGCCLLILITNKINRLLLILFFLLFMIWSFIKFLGVFWILLCFLRFHLWLLYVS